MGDSGPVQTASSLTLWSSRGNFGPKSLFQFYGPPTYDCFRQHYSCSLYQQTGWNPFPYSVMSSSASVPMATNSRHPEIVTQIFRAWGTPTMDMLATVHNTHLPQFMSPILDLEPRPLALDALSQDWQGRLMFMFPPFPLLNKVIQKLRTTQEGEVILISRWWPSQLWFPHLLRLCLDHPLFLSVQPGTTVTTGICLGWQVVPSACLEALMQHYQTAGFLKRSLDSWQPIEDPPQTECTTTGGFAMLTGPQDKEFIHFVPQLLK